MGSAYGVQGVCEQNALPFCYGKCLEAGLLYLMYLSYHSFVIILVPCSINSFFQFRKRERERVYHSIKWGNGEPETLTHLFLKYPLAQIICSQSPWPLRFNSLNFQDIGEWVYIAKCQQVSSHSK